MAPKRHRLPLLPSGPGGFHGLSPHRTGHPAKNTRFSSLYDSMIYINGVPVGIRTRDLQLRRLTLYPAELQAQDPEQRKYSTLRMELSPMDDTLYMKEALKEAEKAFQKGEIPVGAVMVRSGEIIGRGSNNRSLEDSPLGHAEIVAMQHASKVLDNWRFDDCVLYVTLEPCVMCAGAMVQSRLGTLVYGASDPKAGAVGSLYNILRDPRMYHRCVVRSGILKDECAELLRIFFQKRRT